MSPLEWVALGALVVSLAGLAFIAAVLYVIDAVMHGGE